MFVAEQATSIHRDGRDRKGQVVVERTTETPQFEITKEIGQNVACERSPGTSQASIAEKIVAIPETQAGLEIKVGARSFSGRQKTAQ